MPLVGATRRHGHRPEPELFHQTAHGTRSGQGDDAAVGASARAAILAGDDDADGDADGDADDALRLKRRAADDGAARPGAEADDEAQKAEETETTEDDHEWALSSIGFLRRNDGEDAAEYDATQLQVWCGYAKNQNKRRSHYAEVLVGDEFTHSELADTAVLLSVVTVNSKVFLLNAVPDTGKITAPPPTCGSYACSASSALSEDDRASRMQRALAVVVDSSLFGDPRRCWLCRCPRERRWDLAR